jgi:oligoribonuclease
MAEQQVLQFLREHLPAGKSPMCGNSIHKDREMLKRWMPAVDRFCHFRNIDASAFDESLKRQGRNDLRMKKEGAHTALSDTLESIKEYIHYQRMLASV